MFNQANQSYIVSLNVGMPVAAAYGSKEIQTGIFKRPSPNLHQLHSDGITGDGQGDLVNHGGPDKAVCVYFHKHYPYWEQQLERQLELGSFGENWTLAEWSEDDLCIGDILEAGHTLVQVSQPRQPCYKLGLRHQRPELTEQVRTTGYTGLYFRVLREGNIQSGDRVHVVTRHPAAMTISEANRIMYKDKDDIAGLKALLAVEELADSWRKTLTSRLQRLLEEQGGTSI